MNHPLDILIFYTLFSIRKFVFISINYFIEIKMLVSNLFLEEKWKKRKLSLVRNEKRKEKESDEMLNEDEE